MDVETPGGSPPLRLDWPGRKKAQSVYDHGTTIVRGLTLVEALDTHRNEVWRAVAAGAEGDGVAADVAVKISDPAYEPVLPRRLDRRARALTRVVERGTNLVPLLDHGYTTDGRRYAVSPLHRRSLADQLDHGPTPWYPAARLIADASVVVADAHAGGFCFGHLRPSGILIDATADVRVVAYGMSTRHFDDGTAQFMAPELATDGRPVPASDVFSLALILASLIAGRPVDRREGRSEVVNGLASAVPDRILEIIEHGLSTSLRNRYADAEKFARTLDKALREHDEGDDRAPIQLDDPTDPGIAARLPLDVETDHFGATALLDPTEVLAARQSPDHTAIVEPSRMFVLADNVGHFLAVHRRRLASSVAVIGITGAIGASVLIGVGDLLRDDVTLTGGTPVSSSIVDEGTTIPLSSPLNDQRLLENARPPTYENIPTTRPVRRTTKSPPVSTTIETVTTTTSGSSPTTDEITPSTVRDTQTTTESTSKGRKKTTTSSPPTTEGAITTEPPTTEGATTTEPPTTEGATTTEPPTTEGATTTEPPTTTEAATSTTKRKGPPENP